MNYIYSEDFGSLKSESLRIDYIRWNLVPLKSNQIKKLASYFKTLGFNSYQVERNNFTSRQEIKFDKRNLYEVTFILKINFQLGTHIEFSGASADRIYDLIKQESFQWQKLIQHEAILRRIDICHDRAPKSTDIINNSVFINHCLQQFQDSHPNQNLQFSKNQEGLLVKFGNRQSNRHYRVYEKKNLLRFEVELKDKKKLKDYQILLQQSHFEELEKILSHQFFKYSFEIFRSTWKPDHIDWLFHRLRPYQHRDSLAFQQSNIYTHYFSQSYFKQYQQKKDFVTLLQLLTFVRSLDYKEKSLTSKYRQFEFPLRDFLKFKYAGKSVYHYQIIEVKEFFNALRKNIVIDSFTEQSYRMLVTIPEAKVYKSKKLKNSWLVEVWMAEALFEHLCPFLYPDFFKQDLKKHEFAVLFEILKTFSSNRIRKEFDIKNFLESNDFKLSGRNKKQVKDYFIRYLKKFQQEGKIEPEALFPLLNTQFNPRSTCDINQLTSERLSEPFVVFEIIDIKFK
jgi:hypothetical protein